MAVTEEPKVSSPPKDKPAAKAEMVVVNSENTEFSAGVLGGIAGEFVVRGISHTVCCSYYHRVYYCSATGKWGAWLLLCSRCINSQCCYKWKRLLGARKLAMVSERKDGTTVQYQRPTVVVLYKD